jgi:hypothetical protein
MIKKFATIAITNNIMMHFKKKHPALRELLDGINSFLSLIKSKIVIEKKVLVVGIMGLNLVSLTEF